MPPGDQIQQYLTGAWRLMLGKADGLRLLDLTADGFWNSFYAIVVAIPAMVVGWAFAVSGPESYLADAGARLSLAMRLGIIDLTTWIVPLAAIVMTARRTGIADRIVHYVVASNWGAAISTWAVMPPMLLALFWPPLDETAGALAYALVLASLVLTWRLTNAALGKGPAVATAIFGANFLMALLLATFLDWLLGIGYISG